MSACFVLFVKVYNYQIFVLILRTFQQQLQYCIDRKHLDPKTVWLVDASLPNCFFFFFHMLRVIAFCFP